MTGQPAAEPPPEPLREPPREPPPEPLREPLREPPPEPLREPRALPWEPRALPREPRAPAAGPPPEPRALPDGWVRADCHLHTMASGDAVTTLDQLAERACQARLDVVCITDHNETSAALAASARGIGARVIIGEEIRTPAGDVIGLFLRERIPYVLPLAEVVRRIRDQGGLVYLPHPFDPQRSSLGDAADSLCAEGQADIIEVFNAKIKSQALNEQAAALAARWGLPGGAGSDAHDPAGVGAAYLEMPDFDGPASFLAALARARVVGEFRDHAPRYGRHPAG